MARILVTGASGFIGLHLVRRLTADGHDVACLVRKSSAVESLQSLGARLVFGDITDLESLRAAVAGRQIVYQLAGCLRALRREELLRVNEGGLRNVAQACGRTTRTARPRRRLLAGGRRPEPTRPAPPRNRPLLAGLGLRAEQAGRRTGGANVGRPRSHHHRAAADRFRRRRSRHAPRLSADLANRRPHGSRLGAPTVFP